LSVPPDFTSAWSDGRPNATVRMARLDVPPGFAFPPALHWIHRTVGDTEIYFVANSQPEQVTAECSFRVTGRVPTFWQPETGRLEPAPVWEEKDGRTKVMVPLEAHGSVFVVFGKEPEPRNSIIALKQDGRNALPETKPLVVRRAEYGVPRDPARTINATARVQQLVDAGKLSFSVYEMLTLGDPSPNVVKTLSVEYEAGGTTHTASATDPENISLEAEPAKPNAPSVHQDGNAWVVETGQAGQFEATTSDGKTLRATVDSVSAPLAVDGPWKLRFAPNLGVPAEITLDRLIPWNTHPDDGVKHFSGIATYQKSLEIPADRLGAGRRLYLDLGRVEIMAEVTLNGKNLGLLWKPPYRVDITEAAKAGANDLQVRVVNLWPNRMIGDENLPEDSPRNGGGTLPAWPQWILDGQPSPTGRVTFTTWRLWKKGDALLDSGLIGPATLASSQRVELTSRNHQQKELTP